MTYEQVQHLKPEAFKRLCGVRPETFTEMANVLEAKAQKKRKPGRPSKLSIANQLLMRLQYWREYRTYFHMAQSWGVDESTAHRIIRSVEDTLIQSRRFALLGKKKLYAADEVLVVDVTETPVERPKKQQQFYSGKEKRHTLKSQVVVNQTTGAIVCTAHAKGRVHDFRLFKHTRLPLNPKIQLLADKGYQGILKLHPNSHTPKKKPRKAILNKAEHRYNRDTTPDSASLSNTSTVLKIWRILAERYRNRR